MPIDPHAPQPDGVDQRQSADIAALKRRCAALEGSAATVTAGNGAPGAAINSRFYVDTTNLFLYVRIGVGVYKRTGALV